jgi:hypothetical protein
VNSWPQSSWIITIKMIMITIKYIELDPGHNQDCVM